MQLHQSIILGAIQGVTEFLPISSSGHLVLGQHLFGLKEAELFFDICVHMGTLAAVVFFFRQDLKDIIASLFGGVNAVIQKKQTPQQLLEDIHIKMAILIIIGSVPTAIIGLLFKKIASQLFSSVFLVGCALIVTGFLLWATRYLSREGEGVPAFTLPKSLVIGVVQGLAIIPGISRSGSTIAAGLFLGLNRETAARFSFLLSIPAIAGALLLELKDIGGSVSFDPVVGAGALTACIVGYLSLVMLMYIVRRGEMHLFSPYCWAVGIIAIIFG